MVEPTVLPQLQDRDQADRVARRAAAGSDAPEFREALMGFVKIAENLFECETTTENGFHYAFPDDARGEIRRLLSHIEGIVENSPIRASKAKPRSAAWQTIADRRRKFDADVQRNEAKRDSEFQEFMQAAIAKPLETAGKSRPQ
jgi:hypothetical protein